MSFVAKLQRAREVLEQQGRLSVRALGRELDLGGDELDELIGELVDVQGMVVREGNVLVWAPHAGTTALRSDTPPRAHSSLTPPDPHSYTPKHLAEKILQSKSALEGERKHVTVLFADVKGSMELAEQLDPEAWHAILDRFFAILTDGVHRFEGTVNQYTGDGIMALFGAPITHEDHAQRACLAALHLRDRLRAYADELRRTHAVSFAARMGLNSGEVVVGRIGDDLRMDYTAQGHTVGLAQRMEQLAEPGAAYLTAHTARLVEGNVTLRSLGAFDVKGAREPLGVYALEGLGSLRNRLDLAQVRGFSKFVGRGDEVITLEAALERSLNGHGQTVGVVADAGTGKSRLCFEFLQRCRARGFPIVEARGVAHGRNVPLLPMLELFRGYFGIQEHDAELAVREKIAGRLLLLDESLREDLPILFNLLGVPDPERPLPAAAPDELQRRAYAAVRALVRADGQREKPAIVYFEDLHWLDAASDGYLAQIVEATATTRGLVLVNFRPEYRAPWMQMPSYQQLPLVPLGAEAVHELLGDLLGRDASVAGLADFVHGRAGGNPFFVEEIVQTLIETGALAGTPGAYRLVRPVAELVPETEDSRDALTLSLEAVRTLLMLAYRIETTAGDAATLFAAGQRALRRLGDDASLAVLTVTYAALRQNAGAVDEYLALAVEADRIAGRSGDRSVHAAVGPDHGYALYDNGRLEESLALYEAVRVRSGGDARLGMDLVGFSSWVGSHIFPTWALIELGRLREAEAWARRGIELANEHGPEESRCWAHATHVSLCAARGEAGPVALDSARRAAEAAGRSGSSQARAMGHHFCSLALALNGQWTPALAEAEESIRIWRDGRFCGDFAAQFLVAQARALLGTGDAGRAAEVSSEAVAVAIRQGQPVHEARPPSRTSSAGGRSTARLAVSSSSPCSQGRCSSSTKQAPSSGARTSTLNEPSYTG